MAYAAMVTVPSSPVAVGTGFDASWMIGLNRAHVFCGVLGLLLARRRIDLLNFCAGLIVAFACLWLDKGAMNRMNFAIVFAVAALASLSRGLFLYFSAATVIVGAVGYAIGVGLLKLHPEAIDAVLALLFVCAYPLALAFSRAKSRVPQPSGAHT